MDSRGSRPVPLSYILRAGLGAAKPWADMATPRYKHLNPCFYQNCCFSRSSDDGNAAQNIKSACSRARAPRLSCLPPLAQPGAPTGGTFNLPTTGSWHLGDPGTPHPGSQPSDGLSKPNPELGIQTLCSGWHCLPCAGVAAGGTLIAHPQSFGVLGGERDLPMIPLPWT